MMAKDSDRRCIPYLAAVADTVVYDAVSTNRKPALFTWDIHASRSFEHRVLYNVFTAVLGFIHDAVNDLDHFIS